MWSPTHIRVTVQRAKGLLTKGKNGTNNCFVTIALGKEKYQTSIKEKAESNVSWNEECELKIPDQGNRAELVLTCLHRNNLQIDEFLGQISLPLNEMDVYDRPRPRWFKLESKPGKEKKNKERGELEIRVDFKVNSGSLTDLSKKEKHKSSVGKLAGSLMSLGEKRKSGVKSFAKSIGSKMNLSKSKKKDGDDNTSFKSSTTSIDTYNSGSRPRYMGQFAGDADPGVISEDEEEFKFKNLSPKSSTGSLAMTANKLGLTAQNFEPRNPSPLLRNGNHQQLGKQFGATLNMNDLDFATGEEEEVEEKEEKQVKAEMEQEKHKAYTSSKLSPAKPPRSPPKSPKVDEWESKLYGKHLDIHNGSDSLKRRSWELNPVRVPLKTNELENEVEAGGTKLNQNEQKQTNDIMQSSPSISSTSSEDEVAHVDEPSVAHVSPPPPQKPQSPINLLTVDNENTSNDFNKLNATFAQFEQRNGAHIFDADSDEKWLSQNFIEQEKKQKSPQPQPRQREVEKAPTSAIENVELETEQRKMFEEEPAATAQQKRAAEDARLEAELRLNEQRLREEELALKKELQEQEERRREQKRREEDERLLSFAKTRSISIEEEKAPQSPPSSTLQANYTSTTPEQSPKQRVGDNREKRFGKFKYFNKKDKQENGESSSSSPKSTERIIIGHEKALSHSDRRSEITAALAKKYEGKSREELMLIANGMENEALIQRQRVKELEDYLDNLLLRVMETHPKILQNPYSRTTSAKSG